MRDEIKKKRAGKSAAFRSKLAPKRAAEKGEDPKKNE